MDIFYAIPRQDGISELMWRLPIIKYLQSNHNVIISEEPIPRISDWPSKEDLEKIVLCDVLIADMGPPTPYVGYCVSTALCYFVNVLAIYPSRVPASHLKTVPTGISFAKFSDLEGARDTIDLFLRLMNQVMLYKKK